MPTTSRDFQRAGLQRLDAAEYLLRGGFNLDATYLAGYTIECALKALILELTPVADRPNVLLKITSGSTMHRTEVLLGKLRDLGVSLPARLVPRVRRAAAWTTQLRYETGRSDTGETRAFLKTAKAVYDWVEGHLP
ncbi:MAG: HEPN domain-containing protein [Pirellulales bacterium]